MSKEIETEEERVKHEKKMTGYLSMFNFLLALLVGYYYGMHLAIILAALASVIIGFKRTLAPDPMYKKVWELASPYVFVVGIGVINPAVIPVGLAGVLFTALGIHLQLLNKGLPISIMIMAAALALATYGSLIEYPKYVQSILAVETDEKLPNFEVSDLAGNKVQLSDFEDKVVIIDYWATWCGPCKAEFAELEEVVAHFKGNPDVVFLITNAKGSGDTLEKVQNFAQNEDYELPFYIDLSGQASAVVNVNVFPTLAVVDKYGHQRIHHEGYQKGEDLTSFLIHKIEALLKE